MIKKRLDYSLLLFAATSFHVFFEDYLSFWILIFFLSLPMVSLLEAILGRERIRAELEVLTVNKEKNKAFPIRLKVMNTSFFGGRLVRVKLLMRNELVEEELEETLYLRADIKEQVMEQEFSSRYCGRVDFHIKELRIYDFLGLFSFCKKTDKTSNRTVFVVPSVFLLAEKHKGQETSRISNNNEYSMTKAGDDPSEVFEFREYQEGEHAAKIHWKLSDKYDKLMIRDFSLPLSEKTLLLLDLYGSNKEMDGLLDTFSSISCYLLENKIPHDVEWYDSRYENITHAGIYEKEDYSLALNSILSSGKWQAESYILTGAGTEYGDSTYSEVIYLCSYFTLENLTAFCDRMADYQICIVLVGESDKLKKEELSDVAAAGIDLRVIELENMEQSLSSLSI